MQGIEHVQREKDRPHPLPEGTRNVKGSQPNASLGWEMIPALGLEPTEVSGGTEVWKVRLVGGRGLTIGQSREGGREGMGRQAGEGVKEEGDGGEGRRGGVGWEG